MIEYLKVQLVNTPNIKIINKEPYISLKQVYETLDKQYIEPEMMKMGNDVVGECKCGNIVKQNNKYCSECGIKLKMKKSEE